MTIPVRVFLSYSRDSAEHERRVKDLADRLRGDGVDARLDQDRRSLDESLTRWMEREMEVADFTLAVLSEGYGNRRGSAFESHLMVQDLFEAGMRNEKYVPVLFTEEDARFIPRPLRGFLYYRVDTETGYRQLLRHLAVPPASGAAAPAAPDGSVATRRRLPPPSLWRIPAALAVVILIAYLVLRLATTGTPIPAATPPIASSRSLSMPSPGSGTPPVTSDAPGAPATRDTPESAAQVAQAAREKAPAPPPASPPSTERVRATGTGFCGDSFPAAQRKALARRAAEVDARRELAEALAARIQGTTRVRKKVLTEDEVQSTVDQVVRGARIVAERELPDGGYEVTLESWMPH